MVRAGASQTGERSRLLGLQTVTIAELRATEVIWEVREEDNHYVSFAWVYRGSEDTPRHPYLALFYFVRLQSESWRSHLTAWRTMLGSLRFTPQPTLEVTDPLL